MELSQFRHRRNKLNVYTHPSLGFIKKFILKQQKKEFIQTEKLDFIFYTLVKEFFEEKDAQ